MGIIEFFGLRPVRQRDAEPQGQEMQVLLDDGDRQVLDTVRRTLDEAAVTDRDDLAIALLARAVQELQGVARQDHPRVAELRREIDEHRAERLAAMHEADDLRTAVALDAARWRDGWNGWSSEAAEDDDDDAEARDRRFEQLEGFLSDLRAGLGRHEAALQGLRGRAAAAPLVVVEQALGQAQLTLQAATTTWQKLDAARRQAAKRDELESALTTCEFGRREALGDERPSEFESLEARAQELMAELTTPDKLDPADAARQADQLIEAFQALGERMIREHNLALQGRLQERLEAALARANTAKVEPDRKTLEQVRKELDALAAQAYILRPLAIEQGLYAIEQKAHYAEQTEATLRDKLPIADEAQARHGKVPTAAPLKQLLARMVPGELANLGPGPLGVASESYQGSTWPGVVLEPAEDKFRFVPTGAREGGNHSCVITPIGVHDIGVISGTGKRSVTVAIGEDLFTFKEIAEANAAWTDCMLQRGVTQKAYREVELRELEHLVDFSYAFEISAGRLAQAVNALSSRSFDSQDKALQTLIDSLADAPALIPADPRRPQEWVRRIQEVVVELAGFSKDRDTQGTHSPAGNVARREGKAVVIEPEFKSASLDTATIISLARVEVVFGSLNEVQQGGDAWALHAVKRTKERVGVAYCDAVGGDELVTDYVHPGTEVTIQAKPSGNQVWVGATAGAVNIASSALKLEAQTPVYFRMSTKNLL